MLTEDIRLLIAVALPCLTVMIGIIINNSRLGDMNNRIGDLNHRIGDLKQDMDRRFSDVDRRFDDLTRLIEARFEIQDQKLYRVEQVLDARLKHLEERQ